MLWFLVQQKLWRITRQLQVFLFLNRSHHRFPHLLRFRQMMLSRAPQPVVRNMISDATFVAIAAICGQGFPIIWIHTREQSPFNAKSVCSLSHNHKICMFTAKPLCPKVSCISLYLQCSTVGATCFDAKDSYISLQIPKFSSNSSLIFLSVCNHHT